MKTRFTFLQKTMALALISSGIWACSNPESKDGIQVNEGESESTEITVSDTQFSTMKMEWGKLNQGEFSEEITVQGMVRIPVEGMQEIAAYYGGYVQGLKLIEGEPVRKGQVLFYLENPDFIKLQQDYLETKSMLDFLKSEFDRQQILAKEQISAQKNLIKAKSDYEMALAKANSLKKQLALISISADALSAETIQSRIPVYSPVNGYVETVDAIPGQFLPPSGKALSLLSKEHIHVELVLFEKDASKVHKGQRVEFSSPDLPNEKLEAEIYVIGQAINEQRQINVHAHMKDEAKEKTLIPGMFLQAKIQLDPMESLAVPEEAVIEVDGEFYILIQGAKSGDTYQLEKVKVTPGPRSHHLISIQPERELDSTTVVLVKGGFNLI